MRHLVIILLFFFSQSCKNGNKNTANENDRRSRIDITDIEVFLERQSKKDSLNGAVLIANEENILLRKAYGFKDLDHLEKHSVDGKIGLASMGKMFTALSIMKLYSQGKIDLEASLINYLPEIKNQFLRDSVTVRELLSHRSGLGHYWNYTTDSEQQDLNKLYLSILKNSEIEKHGQFNYSNSGYIILGKIIEVVSGMTYEEYIQENIFKSLNMNSTSASSPDGGHYSTLDDLYKFSNGLRNARIVEEDIFRQMIKKQTDVDYGLGFKVFYKGESEIYGHAGGFFQDNTTLGVASALDIIDNKYTIIILTNRNPRMGGAEARNFILDYLTSLKTK